LPIIEFNKSPSMSLSTKNTVIAMMGVSGLSEFLMDLANSIPS